MFWFWISFSICALLNLKTNWDKYSWSEDLSGFIEDILLGDILQWQLWIFRYTIFYFKEISSACVRVLFFYLDKSKCSVCLKNISLEGLHWLLSTRLVHYLPLRWSCHLMLDSREKNIYVGTSNGKMLKIFLWWIKYIFTDRKVIMFRMEF